MPQRPSVVATKTCGADVHVFDCQRRPLRAIEGEESGPNVILRGLSTEGYGISWSPHKGGFLLSGSYDSKICLWDVEMTPEKKVIDAKHLFEAHTASVEDVAWHLKNENMFGSVGDDHHLMIWDLRSSASGKPQQLVKAHEDEVNSLSFNPFNEWILATTSADTTLSLFDLRKLTTSLHTFAGHEGAVIQVEWNPTHETILGSSGADKKLMICTKSRNHIFLLLSLSLVMLMLCPYLVMHLLLLGAANVVMHLFYFCCCWRIFCCIETFVMDLLLLIMELLCWKL